MWSSCWGARQLELELKLELVWLVLVWLVLVWLVLVWLKVLIITAAQVCLLLCVPT
jgi:hypothetical protein